MSDRIIRQDKVDIQGRYLENFLEKKGQLKYF